MRSNYYITGNGGAGKSVAAKTRWQGHYFNLPDEKIFLLLEMVEWRLFDKYDGRPVVLG